MRTILSTLLLFSVSAVFSQEVKTTSLNDSIEVQEYGNGEKLKVRYLLNGSAISLKDKENLLANETYVQQEFNIRTVNKEALGEINLLIDGAVVEKKAVSKPLTIPPGLINIFTDLKGTSFPDFNWKDINGSKYSLSSLKGKVVVMNFWHTTCGPCILEMPLLNELMKQYEDKEVVFIACTLNDETQVRKFLQRTRFDFKQVTAIDPKTIFDPFPGWPIHIVLDKEGLIRFHALGKQPGIEQKLSTVIDRSLAQ